MLRWRKDRELNSLDRYVEKRVLDDSRTNKYSYDEVAGTYADAFGPGNVAVVALEQLAEDQGRFLSMLAGFLDEPDLPASVSHVRRHNARFGSKGYHRYTLWNLVHDVKHRYVERRLLPLSWNLKIARRLQNIGFRNVQENDFRLTETQRSRIRRRFAPGNRALARMFGLDLERFGYW